MHSVLTDTSTVMDRLPSSALGFSFQGGNRSTETSDEKNDQETSDEENKNVLKEGELQEESFSPGDYGTEENQNRNWK